MKHRINIKFNDILDILFILTYSIGYVSLIKFVTYAIFPIPESIQLFFFLSIIYFIRFRGKSVKYKVLNGRLLKFLIIFYVWEIAQGVITRTDSDGIFVVIVNLLSTFIAYKYISNVVYEHHGIFRVINAYSAYMYYTIFTIALSSILIITTIVPPYTCQLGINSLFKSNMETMNATYYFPGFLSVVYQTPSIFLSLFNFPSLSGLSHESQAMYFTIYPAVFLMLYKNNEHTERNIILIFIITTIITTSLTAALCFIITYSFHLLWKFKNKNQFKSALLIVSFIFISILFIINSHLSEIITAFFIQKANFDSDGSSGSYSLNLLLYIISPSAILGQGIFSSTSDQALQYSMNCGYVSSIMIISFYIMFIYTSIKNIFSNRLLCHAIGLSSLYFISHSFKYGISIFNNNYIFFMVFLLSLAEKVRNCSEYTKI